MRPGPALAGRALSLLLRSSSMMIASPPSSAGAARRSAAAATAAVAARAAAPPRPFQRPALLLASPPLGAAAAPRTPRTFLSARPHRLLHATSQQAAAAAAAEAARAAAEAAAQAEAEQAAAAKAAALAALRSGPPAKADAAQRPTEVLDAIVKVFTTSSRPDQWSPWSNHPRRDSSGSGFLIAPRLILSCAHVIADASYITLRRHGASRRFRAEVVAVGHDVDLALLTVPDDEFWETPGPMKPLRLAEGVPRLQSRVRISAYPAGGDNICVTSGVTSRVDVTQYVHSASSFPAIQVDSPINGGASGGPCLEEGGDGEHDDDDDETDDDAKGGGKKERDVQVVGVAFQNIPSGDSQGYIIPMPVVHRFLDEVKRHGRYRGFCSLGIIYSTCENMHLRAYLGMVAGKRPGVLPPPPAADDDNDSSNNTNNTNTNDATETTTAEPAPAPDHDLSGVLITTVQPTAAAHGLLKPGDVLLSFDGVSLANDGTVPFRARERIFFTSLVTLKPTGSTARVEVLRGGRKLPPIDVPLAPLRPLVRVHAYDELPSFFVFAGLVFIPLSQPFLLEWGESWQSASPRRLVEKALHGLASERGQQVVILSQVLVADVNAGYQSLTNLQVLSVDGQKVKDLRSLREAILSAKGPYVVLGMEQDRSLVLDLAAARAADASVLARYRVPYSTSADLLADPETPEGKNEAVDDGGAMVGPDASAAGAVATSNGGGVLMMAPAPGPALGGVVAAAAAMAEAQQPATHGQTPAERTGWA